MFCCLDAGGGAGAGQRGYAILGCCHHVVLAAVTSACAARGAVGWADENVLCLVVVYFVKIL